MFFYLQASDAKMLEQVKNIVFNGKGIVYHFNPVRNVVAKPFLFKRPVRSEDQEDDLTRPASATGHCEAKEVGDHEERPSSAATDRPKRRKFQNGIPPVTRTNRPFLVDIGEKIVSRARRFLAQHRNGEQNQTPAKAANDNLSDLKTPKILKVIRK